MPIATKDIDVMLETLKSIDHGCEPLKDWRVGELVSLWLDIVDDAEPSGTVLSTEKVSLTTKTTPAP